MTDPSRADPGTIDPSWSDLSWTDPVGTDPVGAVGVFPRCVRVQAIGAFQAMGDVSIIGPFQITPLRRNCGETSKSGGCISISREGWTTHRGYLYSPVGSHGKVGLY